MLGSTPPSHVPHPIQNGPGGCRRGITGGKEMDESGRMQLYAQLRLLRLLRALPRGGDLSGEAKACIAAALSFERNLVQFR